MNIRIVCSATATGFNLSIHQAFIYDQVEAIKKLHPDATFHYFFIRKGGMKGYLQAYFELRKAQREIPCDLLHAHVGLSGLIASFQLREPLVCTFHGSDINRLSTRILSALVALRSRANIYVSPYLLQKSFVKWRSHIIPCGVDTDLFHPMDKQECRKKLGLSPGKKYILFASSFDNPVKNFRLLQEAIQLMNEEAPEVLELKGITRQEVPVWMNAADVCVLTSFSEGSSQFIKESLACNRPVISTPVGDAELVLKNTINCKITTFAPQQLKQDIASLMDMKSSNGREKTKAYEHFTIAEKVYTVYKEILKKKKGQLV